MIYKIIVFISLIEFFVHRNSVQAFIPTINEPSPNELNQTSIQIGKTAIQLLKFGQHEEAIKLLELAVKLNPKEDALWISLAEAQIRSNDSDKAILSLNKAIILNPKEDSILFTKASIYMNLNDPENAIKIIKKGLSINNNNERGYFQLGNAEIMLKNYNSALKSFKKSSQINSKFWQSINNEGLVLYELNNPKKAIQKFRLAVKISKNAEPMLALAIVLFSLENNFNESIILAKKALISNPKYVSTTYQAEQLWGEKLQKAARLLFKTKEMIKAVKEAKEKSQ
tara:strand:+ start:73 stop:924 length:852 start_codon:yes stop_codon:yes gene_type:complete